ncbi:MAG TPA: vitamin B12-dependent ribonucleotide reductase [Acidimicrobiales bacterium]
MAIAPERMGIGIQRRFTSPGQHPYDTVVWDRRDARIVNFATGAVAFEQLGVEVPSTWSLNATNILAQKYFRGTLGTPEREWSLKQVVDRVVDTITAWGRKDGYFVDDAEAETFSDELKYLIIHQKAAFNSPVWFNIGVHGVPQQGSACQPYGALVCTPEGLIPIGKLVETNAVGTKVYDAHGLTKIVAVKANGRKAVLRIHTKAGVTLDVTPDHLVWRASGDGTGRFVEAGELIPGDQLTWHRTGEIGEIYPLSDGADVQFLKIDRIEELGVDEVYDIQTESGEYLSGNLRVHNCFILAVEDSMDSILNWYTEEGIIFKGGSGAGVNLSKIRSSKEGLRGGGTASGPVSFMRGADASAGTIKSGGKTRRAAKMVILNADHPDIEDFIWCKAIEERKARALRDAGFDMDLDGKDSYSIQYQNANNSVRVTDEFMQAVLDDADWHLRGISTGEVLETVRARDLFRQIAKAAWECADPGMQFDTTINRWHTAPNTDRINASNPCSEYMHLDNSACNLASLNLLSFLRADGTFDVEGFKAATEVIFTAQEIIVGNADYPTEKIAETSRRFRQLGIGFANLGALLMAQGLPYDSDGGRAWAGALTALLTGHSYATSARTAARMGPFAGYQDNKEPMLNVLRMHRDGAAGIDEELVPPELLSAAQEAWDTAVETAEQYGVRNSQASVVAPTGTIALLLDCDTTGIEPDLSLVKMKKLVGGGTMSIVNQTVPRALRRLGYDDQEIGDIVAYVDEHKSIVGAPHLSSDHLPVFACSMGDNTIHYRGHIGMMGAVQPFISGAISKCVVGDTLVSTADGLIRIESLYEDETPDSFRDEIIEVASLGGPAKTDAFYYGGVRRVRRIELRSGHRVTGTPNHRVLVAGENGLDWKRLDEIDLGDQVAVRYGQNMWSSLPARFDNFVPTPAYGSQTPVHIPSAMTEELAFLLGAFASEGHITRSVWTINITNSVESVLTEIVESFKKVFGVDAVIRRPIDRCMSVQVHSKAIVEFFEYLGCGADAGTKRIPDAVLRSPRQVVLAFLRGLALDAYVYTGSAAKWAICLDSSRLLDDLQTILTNLNIVHSRISKYNPTYRKSYDEVYASGAQAQKLLRLVPFPEPDKAARAHALAGRKFQNHATADVVPGITPKELYALLPRGRSGRSGRGSGVRARLGHLCDPRTKFVTHHTLCQVAAAGADLPEWLWSVLEDNLHFSPVVAAEDTGERQVFDISVPVTHAFVGNGIVNHNTVNVPEEVTVEDLEQLHIEAWQLGLKAIAIYRDNCKVAQPLATAKKTVADPTASPAEVHDAELALKVAELENALQRQTVVVKQPIRERLPRKRTSSTFAFRVADCEGYVTVGEYEDGRPGEVFIKVSKQGSTLSGIMDAFSIAISLGLQHGVPLATFVKKYTNMRFEPAGMTDDPDLRIAQSLMDYIFRRLAVDYLPFEERAELGVLTTAERTQQTLPGIEETVTQNLSLDAGPDMQPPRASSPADQPAMPVKAESDAPYCFQCGVQMQRAGSCHACPSCGTTSGCS